MPRKIDNQKKGFSIMDSCRVEELFIQIKPTLRKKSEEDGEKAYTMTVEVVVGKHDRSTILSAFRRLGAWFEEQVRPEEEAAAEERQIRVA